jgi:hypothetical protein
MNALACMPSSVLDAGYRGLSDSEAGGDLSLSARRPLHFLHYGRNVRSTVLADMVAVIDRFQMVRIHARLLEAQVVKINALWNRAMRFFVKDAVRVAFAEQPVSLMQGSRPEPTIGTEASVNDRVSVVLLAGVVAANVVDRLSLDMSRRSAVDGRKRCHLATSAFAQSRGIIYSGSHGPTSINEITGGEHHRHL